MEDLIKVLAELTECKKEQAGLVLEMEELRDFIDNASTPLHKVNKYGIITWANNAELDLLGYGREEYIGLPISNFHVDPEVIHDILSRLLNFQNIHNYPARLRCGDGSIKHVLINSSVYKREGEFVHTKCFTTDVTDKVNEVQKINDFVAVVSHELKTPLTAILSYIQILLAKTQNGTDNSITNTLARTETKAKKMASMIEDFLSMSKMEEGKIHLHKAGFNLQGLLEELVEDAAILTTSHTFNIVSNENTMVHADREKISYVIMNLLSNAIKYSPMGGKITVGCRKENDKIHVFVNDEGIGISLSEQQQLFERFYRVNNEKNKKVPGFGIGLYTASQILLYHDSKLEVASDGKNGSSFYFSLEGQGNIAPDASR